ncbi:hypothetical protein [uncultured Jatrophihabitans sp.]|uniref:hypothetical protein n=1 Tax=uncultured Jatrophihabitans sp. TaxID=1610747 RepID=UPI0035CBDCF3
MSEPTSYPQQPEPGYRPQPGYQQQPPAQYGSPPPGYYQGQPTETRKHAGLATAALVVGIIGFVFACVPFLNYVAYPLVLLAIVFGLIAFKWGKAKAGAILGVLGLVATILWSVAIAGAFDDATNDVHAYNACVAKAHSSAEIDKCSDKYLHSK